MNQNRRETLSALLKDLSHYLPHQGPINVFIHQNTLQHFEHLPFEEAVEKVAKQKHAEPYMRLEAYQQALRTGRIDEADVTEAIAQTTSDEKLQRIRSTLVRLPIVQTSDETIRYKLLEEEPEEKPELWRVIAVRSKNYLAKHSLTVTWADPGEHEMDHRLAQWASAYLDRGVAAWTMPGKNLGFWKAMQSHFSWKAYEGVDALDAILMELDRREINESRWREFVWNELSALPGWAGTMGILASLEDYLAVRLVMAPHNSRPSPEEKRDIGNLCRRWNFFQFAKKHGLRSSDLEAMDEMEFEALFREVESFDDWNRRRVLHQAYEATYRHAMLTSIQANGKWNRVGETTPAAPSFQALFCIDDREESIRRHLEEVDPSAETLGFAGFFGVDMLYRGMLDAGYVPSCPAPVTPKRKILEKPTAKETHDHHRRVSTLRRLSRETFAHSRTMFTGTGVVLGTGFLSPMVLFTRLFFPRWLYRPEKPPTDLEIEFTDEELADRVANVLRAIGMKERFAPLVFVLGHGSSSVNNPHQSAYQCGACGGRPGDANGRAFAKVANSPTVRELVRKRGINLPDSVHFIGGYHDTGSDDVMMFDTDKVPENLRPLLVKAKRAFEEARKRTAHERCRRFVDGVHLSPAKALAHVQQRTRSMREARPECGHATNSMLIVGRRELTRGLFMDRRAFLNSYDPMQDKEGTVLAGILAAAIPVCAGISLEYYFSYVDNEVYGSGTKLPHNVTGLVGVVNGARSDLRTGLPWQMVEIHEPMRLLTVIETTRENFEKICDNNKAIGNVVRNHWIQLALRDPNTGKFYFYTRTGYIEFAEEVVTIPHLKSSREHYAGKLDALWPARIESKETENVA